MCEDSEFGAICASIGVRVAWVYEALSYDEQVTGFWTSMRQRLRWCSGMVEAAHYRLPTLLKSDVPKRGVALDFAMTFILACSRSLKINDDSVRSGGWATKDQRQTHDVMGKTLLIIGLGRIGRALAARAQAFDMKVIAYDTYVPAEAGAKIGVEMYTDLHTALAQADFVSLHTPLTPETKGMFSTAEFEAMKDSAYFINCGRGPVADEAAMVEALKNKKIAGAGLDCLEKEPPELDNPLFQFDNVMFTPHIGGNTIEASMRCSEILANTVLKALDGEETYNWVNRF